jgi:hypothetical protein
VTARLGWGLSLLALAIGVPGAQTLRAAPPLEEPRHSPNGRLDAARLEAVQASLDSLAARRRNLLPRSDGLLDLRSVFHAHAGDSSHTGGKPEEMLAAAKVAGVQVVFLSDHFRPPRDYMDSWRGLREGVLFIPGSEARGFLLHPEASVFPLMEKPVPELIPAVVRGEGMAFLSHIEERPDHPMTGLTGLEIYNRHHDAKRDLIGMLQLVLRLTDPERLKELSELLRRFPDACLAAQCLYPQAYLDKWDAASATGRFTGVAANDCHHNQIFLLKKVDDETALLGTIVDKDEDMRKVRASLRPTLRPMLAGKEPGAIVARLDFDPYERSFRNVCTHVLATAQTEAALRAAVKAGRAYVSHDWMGDPSGFDFRVVEAGPGRPGIAGEERTWITGQRLEVRSPLPATIRLIRDGQVEAMSEGDRLDHPVLRPGVYRVELWLTLEAERRPWVYSNPIYLRPSR